MFYSTEKFSHFKNEKTFTTEASMLARVGEPIFGQIYPDSADEGLVLCSARTGVETKWVVYSTFGVPDGDIQHWVLKPADLTNRWHPKLRGYTMIIYNT